MVTGIVLAIFLGGVGLILFRTNAVRARDALQNRLQNFVMAYIADTEISPLGRPLLPRLPPDPRFLRPGSGLYAVVASNRGFHWKSSSAIGGDFSFIQGVAVGECRFSGPIKTRLGRVYYYSRSVSLDFPKKRPVKLTFTVVQTERQLVHRRVRYKRSLIGWLFGLGLLLITMQLLLLRWSLAPLRKVASDMNRVERGESDHLSGRYPLELTGLTTCINSFIESEREQRTRYRRTMDDLAHSLKTPLAVVRSQVESALARHLPLRKTLLDQVRRMDELVAYQLRRAVTSGRKTFVATVVPLVDHAEDLARGLEKVYADRHILCEFDIDEGAVFHGERGDLLELMGNLLENAFKWAVGHVLLTARIEPCPSDRRRSGLRLSVEDDGQGIDASEVETLLQRGVRGDERVHGHGIGLSIVQDIVHAYHGALMVDRSPVWGGARFSVRFPADG